MRLLALHLLLVSTPVFAKDSPLVGNWKLVAFQVILDNGPAQDMYGARPKGVLILTREGRMAAIITADSRKAGTSESDRAKLYKSMIAYSGKYRVEGNDFVTVVEMSWNESWNGTEQRRHWRIEGGKLFIESVPQPSTNFPGKTVVGRLVWERDK